MDVDNGAGCYVLNNSLSGSIKCEEFLDELFKKNSGPWSCLVVGILSRQNQVISYSVEETYTGAKYLAHIFSLYIELHK